MKKRIFFIWSLLLITIGSFGSNKVYQQVITEQFRNEIAGIALNDSFPSADRFGNLYPGTVAQNIINVLNTDPSGVQLTKSEREYVIAIVSGLRSVWGKKKAVYGFVGGNAWKHKWNWKDMRDLDEAFRLLFPNGATHDSNGVLFNGSTQYANTFLNPMLAFSNAKNISIGAYINGGTRVGSSSVTVNTISGNGDGGLGNIQTNQTTFTQRTNLSSLRVQGEQDINNGSIPVMINSSNGYLLGTNDSGVLKLFFNSKKIGEKILINSQNASGVALYIGASNANNSSVTSHQNIRLAAVIISDSSTEQECILHSKNIIFAQGILNRQ